MTCLKSDKVELSCPICVGRERPAETPFSTRLIADIAALAIPTGVTVILGATGAIVVTWVAGITVSAKAARVVVVVRSACTVVIASSHNSASAKDCTPVGDLLLAPSASDLAIRT